MFGQWRQQIALTQQQQQLLLLLLLLLNVATTNYKKFGQLNSLELRNSSTQQNPEAAILAEDSI